MCVEGKMAEADDKGILCWFVMRDLKRTNAKQPAYKQLEQLQVECFTPMQWRLVSQRGKRERKEVPFMQDLLFVHDTREHLDPIVMWGFS